VFFSSDGTEPRHIHVKRERHVAKFWLEPVRLANNRGFPDHELNQIEKLVIDNQAQLIQAWDEHFNP
jgi:hypothetical protein